MSHLLFRAEGSTLFITNCYDNGWITETKIEFECRQELIAYLDWLDKSQA